jgi:hypothetical protein
MNAQETVAFCRIVKAACPAQKFDEYTPDVWASMLKDVEFQAAVDAVTEIGKRQPWIGPSDVIAETKRRRAAIPAHRPMREVLAELEQRVAFDRQLELER